MKITLKPLKGMICGEQTISFGDTKEMVEKVLGRAQIWGTSLYYFQNVMRLDFDENGGLDFIEFIMPEHSLELDLYGMDPFAASANDVVALLAKKNDGKVTDCDNGYCVAFCEIAVGLYRDTIPEDAVDVIEEAEADGEPLSQEEIDAELGKANHWSTVGLGIRGYYERRM